MTRREVFARYCTLFEQLTPERLGELEALTSEQIHFVDPFNDLHDRQALLRMFEAMFQRTREPRFELMERSLDDEGAWLRWRFEAGVPVLGRLNVEGVSRLRFDQQGRVCEHLDYWDSAPVYLRLPLLGALLRRIKAKMAAH